MNKFESQFIGMSKSLPNAPAFMVTGVNAYDFLKINSTYLFPSFTKFIFIPFSNIRVNSPCDKLE